MNDICNEHLDDEFGPEKLAVQLSRHKIVPAQHSSKSEHSNSQVERKDENSIVIEALQLQKNRFNRSVIPSKLTDLQAFL